MQSDFEVKCCYSVISVHRRPASRRGRSPGPRRRPRPGEGDPGPAGRLQRLDPGGRPRELSHFCGGPLQGRGGLQRPQGRLLPRLLRRRGARRVLGGHQVQRNTHPRLSLQGTQCRLFLQALEKTQGQSRKKNQSIFVLPKLN